MNGFHRCHAKGCSLDVRDEHVFCPRHWNLLDAKLQLEILERYEANEREQWIDTVNYAVRIVAIKEGRRC